MMRLYKFTKRNYIRNKMLQKSGFTLIEILVAMAIIALMIFAVTPLLVFSVQSISVSGSNSKILLSDKGKVEIGVADRDAAAVASIPVRFSNQPASATPAPILGGVVRKGKIETFLADAPSIAISPFSLNEGYIGDTAGNAYRTINIVGTNTNFASGKTSCQIKAKDGTTISGFILAINNTKSISLKIPANTNSNPSSLTNSYSPYSIRISTNIKVGAEDLKDEVVRADLKINLPNCIIGGNNITSNYISDDGNYWAKKSTAFSKPIRSMVWYKNQYIAVGESGSIYSLADGSNWSPISSPVNTNLNRVIGFGDYFYASGDNGVLLTSNDGKTWNKVYTGTTTKLNSLAGNENTIVLVGDNGYISTLSSDGYTWIIRKIESFTEIINDIIWNGSNFIAVCNNGKILTSLSGESWEASNTSVTKNLNGIAFTNNKFIAVGDGGTILVSSGGFNNWSNASSNSFIKNLKDISWNNNKFFAVGTSGAIITSSDGETWLLKTASSDNYNCISIR